MYTLIWWKLQANKLAAIFHLYKIFYDFGEVVLKLGQT